MADYYHEIHDGPEGPYEVYGPDEGKYWRLALKYAGAKRYEMVEGALPQPFDTLQCALKG
jgi:hypothetical protein